MGRAQLITCDSWTNRRRWIQELGGDNRYRVTVCEARPTFADPARMPDADDVVRDWPDRCLRRTSVDARTVICVLTHDPKFDIPVPTEALRLPVAYVGAMGHAGPTGLVGSGCARTGSPKANCGDYIRRSAWNWAVACASTEAVLGTPRTVPDSPPAAEHESARTLPGPRAVVPSQASAVASSPTMRALRRTPSLLLAGRACCSALKLPKY